MSEWVGIEEARKLPGLRLVLLRGRPSPWSVAARSLFDLKKVPYVKVHLAEEDSGGALAEWTRQASFPAVMYEDERPRTGWAEILLLAERLDPQPQLIPGDANDRMLMFGLAHELCGEMGLAWCRRLTGLAARLKSAPKDADVLDYARKYGSGLNEAASATQRVADQELTVRLALSS